MARLGDICSLQSGGTPTRNNPDFFAGHIPWITTVALNGDIIDERNAVEMISEKAISNSAAKVVPPYSIMVGTRVGIGKVAINKVPMSTSQDIISLIGIDESAWDRKYLLKFIQGKSSYLISQARGATIKGIKAEVLADMVLPQHTLPIQRRIAATLDKVSEGIALCKQMLADLDELVKSQFAEMFGHKTYPVRRLGDVCLKITDGTHKTPQYLESGITFISAKNVVNGYLDFSDVKYISEKEYYEIQKRCNTEHGDVLLTKSGSLGTPTIVDTDEPLGLFESLAVLKYDRRALDGVFLCEQIKGVDVQKQLTSGIKGVAVKHLHLNVIAATKIIVPPLAEQKVFATFVEQSDKSKFAVQQQLAELETLKKSLMQEYFG